ncbi:ferritin-like domain-containing protein [Streptomyces sp. NPDC102402]|uniref:ferritin-like domain-containing protein n=1 Tax=Streptomyces sp. NPDC102402 TaxID=3366169 RepID=UPI003826D3E2
MAAGLFDAWTRTFEDERERRARRGDPRWALGARLHPSVRRSVQRFQVGEDGDGASLIAKADGAGDPAYASAVRLFVDEERNHARLLALLLAAGGASTLRTHWSDRVFVALRRLLGLRLELLVLMIAEVVALRYYRALRDGTDDALTREVAGRILADEERHVPFHCARLRQAFGPLPRPVSALAVLGWRTALGAVALVVAWDHGPALRHLGVGRRAFAAGVVRSSHPIAADMVREGAARAVCDM